MPDLHHRLNERAKLVSLLLSGKSVLMLAPRRIGKTWLMDRVKEDLERTGARAIKVEVAGLSTEQEFLIELCKAIENAQELRERVVTQLLQRLKQLSGNIESGSLTQAAGKLDPRQFLETLVQELNKGESRTVLLIDEFALFVQEFAKRDSDSARRLLYQLRKLWQGCGNVVWFLTGSIGLDEIGRRYDMTGALLGIEPVPLDPFSPVEARSFFEELQEQRIIRPFSFAEGAFEYFVSELGWLSPYHIEHILKLVEISNNVVGVAQIDGALDKILSPAYRLHFAAWDEHIDKNFLPDDARAMRIILQIAAQHANGEVETTYLTRLGPGLERRKLLNHLTALANDAYLVKAGERWRFRSGILRRYWIEYVA
jgi:AAA+ ATPase superfamily predicted ATPase